MRYLTAGSGPPLLLLHGLMGFSFSWSEVITDLGRDFTVYAPDMLNLGLSDRAPVDPSLAATAERMFEFLRALRLGRVSLIGSSHGGAVATRMASVATTRIEKLVLVSPPHPWSEQGRWQIRLFSTALGIPLARLMAWTAFVWMPIGLCRLYGRPARMRPGTIAGYSRPMADPRSMAFLLQVARRWQQDFTALARGFDLLGDSQVLLVWGDRDRIVPLATAAELQKRLPGARLEVMKDCGHLPYEEAPEEFVSIVRRFLAQDGERYA